MKAKIWWSFSWKGQQKQEASKEKNSRKFVACFKSLRAPMLEKLVFKFECDNKVKQSSCFHAYMTKIIIFEQKDVISNKKLSWGKSFVGLNEIFLELWSNKALPSCHHSMGTFELPLLCLWAPARLGGLQSHMISCAGQESSTAWECAVCTQQHQSSACHSSPALRDACGSVYVSHKVLRPLTQHMEKLWPRLTPDPQPLTRRLGVSATCSKGQKHCLALLGRAFAESNSIFIQKGTEGMHDSVAYHLGCQFTFKEFFIQWMHCRSIVKILDKIPGAEKRTQIYCFPGKALYPHIWALYHATES